jgi:hypothetical protein
VCVNVVCVSACCFVVCLGLCLRVFVRVLCVRARVCGVLSWEMFCVVCVFVSGLCV